MNLPALGLTLLLGFCGQETNDARLKTALKELSELASRIDAGETRLLEARKKEGQPDQAMQAIRELLHLDPALSSAILEFVNSRETPEAARAITILALAQPTRQELIVLLGSIIEKPPSERLAQTVFFGFQIELPKERRNEDLLEMLCVFGKGYSLAGHPIVPPMRSQDDFSFANAPKGVNYHALLRSIIILLEGNKFPALRYRLAMAEQMIRETRLQGGDRRRFEKLTEKIYLEGKEGWRPAMEMLAGGREFYGADPLEILGNGLAGFTPDQRSEVIGEVVRCRPLEALRPPFRDYLDEAVEIIGTEPKDTIPSARHGSNDTRILYFLIHQSLDDSWAERLLIKSKSIRLRRLSSELLHGSCESSDRYQVNRYSKFLERMIKDPDGIVVGNARAALRKALERKPAVFDEARAEELWHLLGLSKR